MEKLLVLTKAFPPGVGGTHTVMGNLFRFINPKDYIILHDGAETGREKEFDYLGEEVNWPPYLSLLRKIYPLDLFLIPVIVYKLFKIKNKYGIKRCLVIYPDPFFATAGYIFARLSKIKYFLYFHDTWIEDEIRITDIVKRILGKIFEKGMIKNSAVFFTLTQAMREFYLEKYGIDSIILPHSVNLELLNKNSVPPSQSQKTKIVYSGAIFESQYFSKFVEAVKNKKDIEFIITTFQSVDALKKMGIEGDNIEIVFFKDKKGMVDLQRKADILYIAQSRDIGFDARVKTGIPTKLFDYLLNLRPILIHAPKEGALYRFCQKNELAYTLDSLKKEDILRTIVEIKEGKFKINYQKMIIFLENYDRIKISQRFSQVVFSD